MKKEIDPRINVKRIGVANYFFLFLAVLFICGSYAGLYFLQIDREESGLKYIVLSMGAYIVVISFLITLLFAWLRKKFIHAYFDKIKTATRKVAQGDYSVRIEPSRSDGKKDEFEVVFEDFNSMVEELGSTEMLKKEFISNVSHELKTPISVIHNYATILQEAHLSEADKIKYTQTIVKASSRLSVLVTNILQMSQLENQKISILSKRYNICEQIRRCALGFESIWEEKNILLDIQLEQDIFIESDEDLLDIVWNNLLSNAFKFTPPGGSVKIFSPSSAPTLAISIADSGCGINDKKVDYIFDKFYQADTSHATKGNGLGLSMVKEVVKLLGGTIAVDSIENEGTIFTVSL
ncbi:hypothetical protein BAU15_10310 [Enterococcus sp. JM4C]|uniref:HAMP domain-containing sensor histidine kinase n=1 Tax=Candidatus Enterococcus huntleyi TaxID=1857217 RepID=UPI00137B47ED|nr:HAMP domain-containing sensor histidine kinase [Enterococcus sp. JM4C]KAF1296173.1 hypothetical protein BAU15_10310 [Enterococcus sp. JM4C]